MDFLQQYNTYQFQRGTTQFTKNTGRSISSGSTTTLGGAYIILSAQSTTGAPCRLRLYSDEQSMLDDDLRPQGNFNLSQSVALVSDIVLTDQNVLLFDPPLIGNTFVGGQTWYNLSGSNLPTLNVQLNYYPLRLIGDSTDGTSNITISETSVPTTGNGVSGTITTSKSFLIISGSATQECRLRLYSRPHTEIPVAEQSRAFGTTPQDGSLLIADLMFDTANFQYPLVPVLEAYTWTNENYSVGSGQVGYILENRTGSPTNITVSLYTYTTES